MKNSALVVIDLQNDITKIYREIIENVNEAIDWAVRNDLWVVYIQHNMNMHPVLADVCDTVLTLLSGGFALLAVGIVWLKEFLTGRSST